MDRFVRLVAAAAWSTAWFLLMLVVLGLVVLGFLVAIFGATGAHDWRIALLGIGMTVLGIFIGALDFHRRYPWA